MSTKNRKPFEIVYYETYATPELAKTREWFLKKNPKMFYNFKERALLCASLPKGRKEVVG
jgi:predicted GIY-YIG superfamily endonuclease